MDAATEAHVIAQVGRLLDAEVIFENRKRQMGQELPPIIYHHKPPLDERPRMSITGANYLAGSIRERIAAAKAKVGQVTSNADTALAKLNSAADAADQVNKAIEAEAESLMTEIGQFSNGAPE